MQNKLFYPTSCCTPSRERLGPKISTALKIISMHKTYCPHEPFYAINIARPALDGNHFRVSGDPWTPLASMDNLAPLRLACVGFEVPWFISGTLQSISMVMHRIQWVQSGVVGGISFEKYL